MRQKISIVLFLYLTTNLSATTLNELVESGLNNNSAIKSSNLQELISAQNLYIDALKNLREIIAKSVSIGKKARIDLIKSDSSIQEAEGKLAQIESSLKMIKSTLKTITHISIIDFLEPIDVDMTHKNSKVDKDFDNLDRFKLQNLEIRKGDRLISKVKASKRPQVALKKVLKSF